MLAEQGYHVRPVPDGPPALAAVRTEPPGLILLDIRMPEMDGYQVCEHLKADPQTRDIPIIFISALDAAQDKVRAFHAGGVDYVTNTGMLVYCNAGHCPPLHFRAQDDKDVHELVRTGIPLGIFEDRTWGQETVQLDPGNVLVLYTDGITEAYYEPPLLFGEERL